MGASDISESDVEEMKTKKDVYSLLEVLKNSRILGTSIFDKYGALDKIVEIGDDAVEPLIEALRRDKDEVVQWVAAEALGRIGDKRALEPLIKTLKNHEHPDVRWHAAEALGEMGDERALEHLHEALYDDDEMVRGRAVQALNKIEKKERKD